MTHKELHNFWKFWATGETQGKNSFVTKMPDDRDTCKELGQFCLCTNYAK